jgi:signal transduction histidine kinase
MIVTPMFVGGRLVGLFEVESDRPDTFKKQDLQMMTSLANQAAAAIEAARLLKKSRANALALGQWARNLMTINRVAATLASSLDAYEILNMTVQHLVELSGIDYGSALILERDGQHGRIIIEHPDRQLTNLRLSLSRLSSARETLETGTPYAIEEAEDYLLIEPLKKQSPSLDVRSLLLVPLVARGDMIGILLLAALDQAQTFSSEVMDICQTVASQAAVAVANARLMQDIQQQKHALLLKSQELAEESSKLDAILNNIADGLVVTDPNGRIILNNPAFCKMAGLPVVNILPGHLLAESFSVTGLQPLADQALESPGHIFTDNLELEDGRVLKTTATALRLHPTGLEPEKGKQTAGVVIVLRDITHEVEVDRMKTDFIAAVSHELRSPLTSILGFASLIQRDLERRIVPCAGDDEAIGQAADRMSQNLTIIENESMRLTRLINDMLDVAKMEAGRMEWRMDETDLTEVIGQAVATTFALAEGKGLSIRVQLPDNDLPTVWADRDRLVQVMTNLLNNAIKFTGQGQIEVRGWTLEVKGETLQRNGPSPPSYGPATAAQNTLADLQFLDGKWVTVSITDTGVGIRPEDMPHAFEKFRQVGDPLTDHVDGTGLGLSICKEIIEHHGGHIWAESEQGKGSTFSFALLVKPFPAKN